MLPHVGALHHVATLRHVATLHSVKRRGVSRRTLMGVLGTPLVKAFAQGVSSRGVKAQPRGKPSGLPFDANFVDVAAQAGLRAPLIYGGAEKKTYIVETV